MPGNSRYLPAPARFWDLLWDGGTTYHLGCHSHLWVRCYHSFHYCSAVGVYTCDSLDYHRIDACCCLPPAVGKKKGTTLLPPAISGILCRTATGLESPPTAGYHGWATMPATCADFRDTADTWNCVLVFRYYTCHHPFLLLLEPACRHSIFLPIPIDGFYCHSVIRSAACWAGLLDAEQHCLQCRYHLPAFVLFYLGLPFFLYLHFCLLRAPHLHRYLPAVHLQIYLDHCTWVQVPLPFCDAFPGSTTSAWEVGQHRVQVSCTSFLGLPWDCLPACRSVRLLPGLP